MNIGYVYTNSNGYLNTATRALSNGRSWQWAWLKCREEFNNAVNIGFVTDNLTSAVSATLTTYGMNRNPK